MWCGLKCMEAIPSCGWGQVPSRVRVLPFEGLPAHIGVSSEEEDMCDPEDVQSGTVSPDAGVTFGRVAEGEHGDLDPYMDVVRGSAGYFSGVASWSEALSIFVLLTHGEVALCSSILAMRRCRTKFMF